MLLPLDALTEALIEADQALQTDLQQLAPLDQQELGSLADLEDPISDGIEGSCI